jgi:membrane protease YdiL (CAAX protease family)
MDEIAIYLTGLGITTLVSFLIVIYFKPHLKRILLELNGDKERPANFWVAYTTIILMLVPLIFAIWIVPEQDVSVFFQISRQLKWSLMGLVASIVIIGLVIINFVPREGNTHDKE